MVEVVDIDVDARLLVYRLEVVVLGGWAYGLGVGSLRFFSFSNLSAI